MLEVAFRLLTLMTFRTASRESQAAITTDCQCERETSIHGRDIVQYSERTRMTAGP